MKESSTLPVASCVAVLEDLIAALPEFKVGPVAKWTTGEVIFVKGKFLSTSKLFPRLCVRWVSGEGKGLFGKGLAGYSGPAIDPAKLADLPLVK